MIFFEAPRILIDIVGNVPFFQNGRPSSWVISGNFVTVASAGWFYG